MVLFAVRTDNTGFDPNSPEYAVYKNTMFKDCYKSPGLTQDCASIKTYLLDVNTSGVVALIGTSLPVPNNLTNNNTIYNWCEVISCFNNFKVIPSTPRPSAFWPTILEVWNKAAVTFLMAFWQLHKLQKALYSDENTTCKGTEWDVWLIMAWDLASFIWWCIGFGRFAMIPTQYPMPSMLGWVSLWKYCYIIHYHPFDTRSGFNSVLPYPAYDCLASRILDAPGSSPCSAEQICSNKRLFRSYDFIFPHRYISGYIGLAGLLVALSIASIIMVCVLGAFPLIASMVKGGSTGKWRRKVSHLDFGFAGSLSMAAVACMIYAALTGVDAFRTFEHLRQGTVAFNSDCNVLHVNMSPWRYYLDVDYELPLRVARMWFNS
ncbi:hypothetical protein N7471_006803 [Penicillium samsonianum]|uniref:uncharacterized protein n=1 Tax=Penicillium samsonianum TaxID=1882272 RepID=UPI0025485DFE|nr:uncharacterized protein N7471_006803 [Penicillium samsonianum]KAJ6140317.1 hypothetical protein N7471_006803 [Penicillium samsonianum]